MAECLEIVSDGLYSDASSGGVVLTSRSVPILKLAEYAFENEYAFEDRVSTLWSGDMRCLFGCFPLRFLKDSVSAGPEYLVSNNRRRVSWCGCKVVPSFQAGRSRSQSLYCPMK